MISRQFASMKWWCRFRQFGRKRLATRVSGYAGIRRSPDRVLEVSASTAYLCVGSNDGAQTGQELTVYRFDKIPNPNTKSTAPLFKKQEIGKIKILEIVDEHMVIDKILSGNVKAGMPGSMPGSKSRLA